MSYELYKALERPKASIYGKIVQTIIFINIIVNITASLFLVFADLEPLITNFILIIEYLTVFMFCIELILRYIFIGHDTKYKGITGRLKYTTTPFIVIDILSLVPYFITGIDFNSLLGRVFRFLKFFRILKFLRIKGTVRDFFSLSFFATTSIAVQFLILLVFSAVFILIFSLALKDIKLSAMIFLGPGAIAEVNNYSQAIFGFFELVLGLVVGGTLISIISSLLTNVLNDVKSGYYPYKGKNHIIIINDNEKINFILKEINYYYTGKEKSKDVVIFLPFSKSVEHFYQNINNFSNIRIIVIKGNPLLWNTYEKISINNCDRVIFLKNSDRDKPYIESKITRFIVSNNKFYNRDMQFTIESNTKKNQEVYNEIFSQSHNNFNIVNSEKIIQSILNRSIVDPTYFNIYLKLLSFNDWNIVTVKYKNIFNKNLSYKDLCILFDERIPIGIIRNGTITLNPNRDTLFTEHDSLISIMKNTHKYQTLATPYHNRKPISINKPKLKLHRNICIVGDFDNIDTSQINDFLDTSSIEGFKSIVLETENEYLSSNFWINIIKQNFDMIILNLEDDFEFNLTMYLRNEYKENELFLSTIVNIIHDPIYEDLLYRKQSKNNTILSDKIAAEYITQATFNSHIIDIFKEITHSEGSEFYTLDKDNYPNLFSMDIPDLKLQLLENDMTYIGAIINGYFEVNSKSIAKFERIVVLAQGI